MWLYDESKLLWFVLIVAATLFFVWFSQTFFVSDILYYNTYGEQLSLETIDGIIGQAKRYSWLGYVIAPLMILLRVCYATVCLYVASLFNSDDKLNLGSCFNIALKADVAFVFAGLFGIIYHLIVPSINLAELSSSPFSVLYFLNMEAIPPYFLYPIGLINVFEFFYWFLLIILVRYRYRSSYSKSFNFVAASYGSGLLLIILVLTLIAI